jgi:hypothetical protein
LPPTSTGYYHLASADDEIPRVLGKKDFFRRYTKETKRVAGGELEVMPLELVAQKVNRT